MNDFKIKTINELHFAMEQVESAREDSSLSKTDKKLLEEAFLQLRNIERSIIRQKENELVESLSRDTKALEALALQVTAAADKLAAIGKSIQKAARVVQAFINILNTANAAGLL